MGPAMSDIFEETEVWCVTLPGLGRVYLQEHNKQAGRTVICRKCRGDIRPGGGFRFRQEIFLSGSVGNGYLCRACIALGLKETPRWQWNAIEGMLFRANGYTLAPIAGARLADLFMQDGAAGLMAGIREALEEKKSAAFIKTR